jgi:hypothetical protein
MRPSILTQLALLLVVGSWARAGQATPNDPAHPGAQPAEDEAAVELREHHRHHHLGGVTPFVAMGLDTLGVSGGTGARIDELQASLHACMAPAGAVERELLLVVASGVESGGADSTLVDEALARLDAAVTSAHDCSAAPLNQLNALLPSAARAALADKVLAHWEVWLEVNQGVGDDGRTQGNRLARLGRKLDLSVEQSDEIAEGLRAGHAGRLGKWDVEKAEVQVRAFASGFLTAHFDSRSVSADADALVASHGALRMVAFYEAVTPALTAEQRTELAADLREHAGQQPTQSAR